MADAAWVKPQVALAEAITAARLGQRQLARKLLAEIVARARSRGRIAGVHTGSPAMVKAMLAQGFHFASLLTDVRIFANALSRALAAVRDGKARMAGTY